MRSERTRETEREKDREIEKERDRERERERARKIENFPLAKSGQLQENLAVELYPSHWFQIIVI